MLPPSARRDEVTKLESSARLRKIVTPGSADELEDHVMLAGDLGHLDADLITGPRARHRPVLHLDRVDGLREVGGVALDADRVSDRDVAGGDAHCGDADLAEEMSDDSDLLLSRGSFLPRCAANPLGSGW